MSTLTLRIDEASGSCPRRRRRSASACRTASRARSPRCAAGGWLVVHAIAFLPWLVFAIPGLLIARRFGRRVKLPWAIVRKSKPATEPAPEKPADAA
jgi:hypothetical protein